MSLRLWANVCLPLADEAGVPVHVWIETAFDKKCFA